MRLLIAIGIAAMITVINSVVYAQTPQYNFQIWPENSEIYLGDPIYIAGKLCPVPSTSDNLIHVKITIIRPNGSMINFDEKSVPICDNYMAESTVADTDGTWSAISVADWTENNKTFFVTSNKVQLLVKEPLYHVAQVIQLSNITNVSGNLKWDSDGKFLVFQTLNSRTDLQPTFSWWKVNPDGTHLENISDTKLQTLNLQNDSTKVGSIVVFSPPSGHGYGGYVYLKSTDGSYQQVLYYSKNPTPLDPAISSDGKFVAFGSNNAHDNQQGIWLLKLAQPIPEFPFAIPILLISVMSIIVFFRIKFAQ